jgi:L-ascorbate metabolism protein UlaG (beta-lactamase superfamily)
MKDLLEHIHWLGHAGFCFSGGTTVYIDPYKIKEGPRADIILITHEHYDHCSLSSIRSVLGGDTVIVANELCAQKLRGNVRVARVGENYKEGSVEIQAVAAYNINKQFHPRSGGGLGYVVKHEGRLIYHAGDTDCIPEMSTVRADIALLPVSGVYVMSPEEAARAADMIKPRCAVPMHYGMIVGSRSDAERFRDRSSVPVEILEEEKSWQR